MAHTTQEVSEMTCPPVRFDAELASVLEGFPQSFG